MTALETIQDGAKTFAKDVADGFFAITHNGLAFVGLVVFCLATLFGMRPDLRMGAELRLISWLQDRQSELMSSDVMAVERATVLVGPALILTTVVLACGLGVTVFSDLPSLRLFGWLSAFAMVAALIADLFILRPTAMWLISMAQKLRGGGKDAAVV